MVKTWLIEPEYQAHEVAGVYSSYEVARRLIGERVGFHPLAGCQTAPADVGGRRFFVKYYQHRGQWWRALGRSRARREWRNIGYFRSAGVPTTPPVAFGEDRSLSGLFNAGGIIVTEEVRNTSDMHILGENRPELFADRVWFNRLSGLLAGHVRDLHQRGFFHNDLNWRNILVRLEPELEVFIFDCPSGRSWPKLMHGFRSAKDLAHLDKLGQRYLRRTQRLRFFLDYTGHPRLTENDRKQIRRILRRVKSRSNREPRNIYGLS